MEWKLVESWVSSELTKRKADHLLEKLNVLRERAIPDLRRINKTFPYYTIHDERHKDNVCKILGILIHDKVKDQMSALEIYLLVGATYLHDIGMADIKEIFDKVLFETWRSKINDKSTSDLRREFIREFHHERSYDYVLKHFSEFGIENVQLAELMMLIARGHRHLHDLTNHNRYPRNYYYQIQDVTFNTASLAYYLHIADELDLTFERMPYDILQKYLPNDKISSLHWEQLSKTVGLGIDHHNKLINVTANCKDQRIYNSLRILENKIQEKINIANQILDVKQYEYFPTKIFFQIVTSDFEILDLSIKFEMTPLIPVLTEFLYPRKEDAVREFIQNALDACFRLNPNGKNEERECFVQIELKNYKGKQALWIEDNGYGMSSQFISNYFTKIGNSYYNSEEYKNTQLHGQHIRHIGEFGIGILSGFMIANKIIIDTKSNGSKPWHLELYPDSSVILAVKGKRINRGTRIILPLLEKVSLDPKIIAEYLIHVDIPIRMKFPDRDLPISNKWLTGFDMIENQIADVHEYFYGYDLVGYPHILSKAGENYTIEYKNDKKLYIPKSERKYLEEKYYIDHERFTALVSFPLGLDYEDVPFSYSRLEVLEYGPDEDNPYLEIFEYPILSRVTKHGIKIGTKSYIELSNLLGINLSVDMDIHDNSVRLDVSRSRIRTRDTYEGLIRDLRIEILKLMTEKISRLKSQIQYNAEICSRFLYELFDPNEYEEGHLKPLNTIYSLECLHFIRENLFLPIINMERDDFILLKDIRDEIIVRPIPDARENEILRLISSFHSKNKFVYCDSYSYQLIRKMHSYTIKTFYEVFEYQITSEKLTLSDTKGPYSTFTQKLSFNFVKFKERSIKAFIIQLKANEYLVNTANSFFKFLSREFGDSHEIIVDFLKRLRREEVSGTNVHYEMYCRSRNYDEKDIPKILDIDIPQFLLQDLQFILKLD